MVGEGGGPYSWVGTLTSRKINNKKIITSKNKS